MTDSPLIRACLAGDRHAWETLISRYRRLIYSIPIRCGLGTDDADDLFQTVCLRLLENLENLKDEEHLTAWIITTGRREAWRVSRQKRRREALLSHGAGDSEAELEAVVDADPLPEQVVVQLTEEQLTRQALEELGGHCAALLRLLYQTDPVPAYAEIARQLHVPEGSIGPTRARCLQKLRRILERIGF